MKLRTPRPVRACAVRVGCAGWSIPRRFAEALAGEGSHLERTSRVLACAEINSTFYRPPMASTWARWAESVAENFRFSVKAPRTITHESRLVCAPELLAAFLADASRLGPKLGPVLFQLPPKLAFDEARARTFFAMLRGEYEGPVALEPRHRSWFTGGVNEILREFHIGRVGADPPRVEGGSEPAGWDGLAYWRLHGSPRMYYSDYGDDFLRQLAGHIEQRRGPGEVWVIFDNTASGAAMGDALKLQTLLAARESPGSHSMLDSGSSRFLPSG